MALVDFKIFPSFAQTGTFSTLEEALGVEGLDGTPVFNVTVPTEAANANSVSLLLNADETCYTNHTSRSSYSNNDEWIIGSWIRLSGTVDTTPTIRGEILLRLFDGVNDQISITANAQAGGLVTLDLRRGGVTGTIVSTSPSGIIDDDDTWSFYEFKIKISNTVGSIICMKNGVEVWNDNGFDSQEQTSSTANRLLLGGMGATGFILYNSIYICDTTGGVNDDFLGEVVAIASKTTADTAQADWSIISGGSGFLMLDEFLVSSSTNSITSTTLADESTFDMDNHHADFNGFNVLGVKSFIYAGDITAGTSTIKLKLEVSAGINDFGAETYDVTFLPTFDYFLDKNPITTNAWTIDEYNSIQLSVERIT